MLVKELIEKLKEMPQDALIVVPGDGDFAVAKCCLLYTSPSPRD